MNAARSTVALAIALAAIGCQSARPPEPRLTVELLTLGPDGAVVAHEHIATTPGERCAVGDTDAPESLRYEFTLNRARECGLWTSL